MKKVLLTVAAMALTVGVYAQDVVSATEAKAAAEESAQATAAAAEAAAATEAPAPETPKYWKKGFDVSLTGTQNFISADTKWSSAWYNGGNSSLSGLGEFKAWFNYEGPQGLMWDNLVELKYGVNTTFAKDAAGREWHISDDKTAYSTKLGYAIGKGWHVAMNADLQTTLFENYITVDDDRSKVGALNALSAAAFAPLRFNTGIGFDWKYANEAKNVELSIYIAPYAYKLVYVGDRRVFRNLDGDGNMILSSISDGVGIGQKITDETAYKAAYDAGNYDEAMKYIAPESLKSYNLGSRFDVQYRQKFNDYVSLESRLQFYTNYVGIEVDWEIIANFKIWKLLTARISVNPRYDSTIEGKYVDNVYKSGWDQAKLQLKEVVSIGLAYRFEK
ncbi:MAG: DUF3078 domain-containing protein [Paludibacteraceae bacterium]|nr:DUF3078 domain-containing protein [Paludibacteraceae bacterium]